MYLYDNLVSSSLSSIEDSSLTAITIIFAAFAPFTAGIISSNTIQFSGDTLSFFAANRFTSGKFFPLDTSSVMVIESK